MSSDDFYKKIMDDEEIFSDIDENFDDLIATDDDLKALQGITNHQAGLPMEIVDVTTEPTISAPKCESTDAEREQDFQYARDKIYDTVEVATNALKQISQIAPKSAKGRDFEVISLLTKTIVEAQKLLLDLHKKKQDIETNSTKSDDGPKHYTQNNVIVTTAELDKLIKGLKNNESNDE